MIADGHPLGGWYRQLVSMESFVARIGDRWFEKHMKTGVNVFSRSDIVTEESWTRINSMLPQEKFKVEYKDFESVWDFYKHIGYDHKNKSKKQLDFLVTNWKD